MWEMPDGKPFWRFRELWLPDLPDIQLVQNYHRIPLNTTYWRNWPTEDNPTSTMPRGA